MRGRCPWWACSALAALAALAAALLLRAHRPTAEVCTGDCDLDRIARDIEQRLAASASGAQPERQSPRERARAIKDRREKGAR